MKSQISGWPAKITQKIQISRDSGNRQHRGPVTRQEFLASAHKYQRDQRMSKNFHNGVYFR